VTARSEWRARQRKIAEAKGMTLKQLREAQPRRDQGDAAFRPAPTADQQPYSPWPRTLEELKDRCLEYGVAAFIECQWMCVERWLWGATDPEGITSLDETRSSVSLIRAYERVLLGFPPLAEQPSRDPIYYRLSHEEQQKAQRLADAARLSWDRAGRPHLTPDRTKLVFQIVTSSPAWLVRHANKTTKQETE